MWISLRILARSAPRGAESAPRSGGSWDPATEQQRADAELNARDATINAVTALQPWTPTVAAQCHRSAGTWPRRRAEICARSDSTSCRCHVANINFTTQQRNLEALVCGIYRAKDTHVARVPENFNPSCRCTTATLSRGIETRPGTWPTRPPHYLISPGDPTQHSQHTLDPPGPSAAHRSRAWLRRLKGSPCL